ncbi:MAG: hypothetical protein V3V00_11935 [Saprospiraceae bacterium]
MRNTLFTFIALICIALASIAQNLSPSDLHGMHYRNIGPANQGGRIVDIDAHNDDFTKVYAATASGGVWKSENAGTTWIPIFDDYEVASIGDIAIDQKNKNIVWVGTGEANNRNSVSWGNGIYKSIDAGETFINKGLESTHQIARVLVHPDDSDNVCVCAIGHLWGYSGERGLFMSKNGGDKWQKLTNGLPNDGKTGCIDLVRDSKNPDILYASFYHRLRQPWHFHSGGEKGGIYKSTNGGTTWRKLTNGLPQGPTGRIGLAIYNKNPNILMVIVEAKKSESLDILGSGIYRSENGGESWTYVNTYNNRPFYYSQIRINPNDDQRVYVLTTTFRVSQDGGKTLKNGSEDQEVHGDFHAMWIDQNYKDRYYLGADKGLSKTHDHGAHFTLIDNLPIAQFYRINHDMRDPYFVYGGMQDNGSYATASFSRDNRGILNDANWKMHWGDGQDVAANPDDWTDMYSSMENGTYLKYNPLTRHIKRISPNALNTINYWEYFDKKENDKASASRWNWSAPLMMSPHNSDVIFVGGNHVYRSQDKGNTWEIISPDLSSNHVTKRVQGKSGGISPDNTGAETHCAIHSLSISPISENIIWVGTDDGNIQVTKNEENLWYNVRKNIKNVPDGLWVSRIEASHFHQGRAYVTFDGHRSDNFDTWIFVTDDFGKSWKKITSGFSKGETVRVIREDHKNENLLFAGTETGVWYTINRGKNWNRIKLNMPTVSVYDLKIHPRENDLIVGTHGRSIWILEDISPLQQMSKEVTEKDFHLFDQKQSTLWQNTSRGGQRGHFLFAGDNPSEIINPAKLPRGQMYVNSIITYFVKESIPEGLTLSIAPFDSDLKKEIKVPARKGINRYHWNREYDVEDFTSIEQDEIEHIMKRYTESISHRRVKSAFEMIRISKDGMAKRRRLETLSGGYLSLNIDEKFLVPRATIGSYKLLLTDGKNEETNTLNIKADPMMEIKK